ncbi:MAG: hypothetical protein CMA53_01425 [Euryarchaeota archaeon]|nr:hypothetical protein [Euryarchaeota archaeon]|tara:strand:+ start:5037 stop:5606 length:570 start_codon:yes stop_codon:yes gene_type:complete
MNKIILTDCDGVLMDWERSFDQWMINNNYSINIEYENSYNMAKKYNISEVKKRELVKYFNESSRIGWLPPLRDAIKYIKKLHEEHGYVFHMITSLSKDQYASKLRIDNTERLFGKSAFEKYVFLDVGADKDNALKPYADSELLWVEDKHENAVTGDRLGLNSVLISHDHNKDSYFERYDNWKELYEEIK